MANSHVAFQTILLKEISRFTRVWIQTLLPPGITTLLYFLIFGHVMGARIGLMHGVSYIQYIAPGLVMMNVINNAYANTSSSFLQAKFFRSIEELLAAPVSNNVILAGFIMGGVIRGLAVAIVVTTVALCFTHIHVIHPFLTLMTVLLTAALFSIAGMINAIYAKKFDDISIIPTFILTPLTYLGGVFYSVHLLPGIWPEISLFNPILYFVSLFRYGLLNISDINIYVGFTVLIGMLLILYIIAWWLIDKGVGIKT